MPQKWQGSKRSANASWRTTQRKYSKNTGLTFPDGGTSVLLHRRHFMNEPALKPLTLSPAASPASRFPWLESKRAKGMNVTSGLKCSGLSESLRRVGWSVRTFLESCALPLPTLSKVWSVKAITPSCLILKLRLSERRTGASASHLWPTATARDYKDGTASSCANVPVNGLLGRAVHIPNTGLWKTPIASDASDRKFYLNNRGEPNLSAQVKLFPTPRVGGSKGKSPSGMKHGDLAAHVGGSLNPDWVEWLMGYPIGWTEV